MAKEKESINGASIALANYYLTKKDYKKSMYWAFNGAERGSSDCMVLLSNAYRKGVGLVQDYEEGFKWTYLAAATGNEWSKNWVKKINEAQIECPQIFEKYSPMQKIKGARRKAKRPSLN